MKRKAKRTAPQSLAKSAGTRTVEKYRPRMNDLTEAERKELMQEGLSIIYRAPAEPGHARRR